MRYANEAGAGLLDDWVAAWVSVNDCDEIPDANFSVKYDESGLRDIRTFSNSISASLKGHLDTVHPTVSVPNPRPHPTFVRDDNHAGSLEGSLALLSLILEGRAPTQVFTISCAQNEDTLSPKLAACLCTMYAQLTVRGTPIIVSSGDGLRSANYGNFVPTFPASCPFVTSASNHLGRALPNIVAHGTDCDGIVVDGKTACVDNAGVAFTAVIGVLNDRLIVAGRHPLES